LPARIPAWASGYKTVTHVSKGRTPEGWDCWGLLWWCCRTHLGIALPSYADRYSAADAAEEIAALIAENIAGWRELRDPMESGGERARLGDGVLMRKGRHPCHVGLALDRRRMLHADSSIKGDGGTDIEDFDGLLWGPRVVGIYRHPALEAGSCRAA
jgi:cell wall-associated NlpC family hydrolase